MIKKFIGIDVHLSRFTAAYLDENLLISFVNDFTLDELNERIISVNPEIIGVDAPMGLNIGLMDDDKYRKKLGLNTDKHHNKKVSEYELTKRGIFLYPTPKLTSDISGWKSWMSTGFELYEGLKRLGFEAAKTIGPSEKVMVEVFPHASFTTLAGKPLENKSTATGMKERIQILEEVGVSGISEYLSGSKNVISDRLDAIVAAYTAYTVWNGNASFVGDAEESVIAVPVKELKDKYTREQRTNRKNDSTVLNEDNSFALDSLIYKYKNIDSVIWFKYFTPMMNTPSIENTVNFRQYPELKVTLQISSEEGKTIEATFEALKNRVDGMKVVSSDRQKLRGFWGSHGNKKEYKIKVAIIVTT